MDKLSMNDTIDIEMSNDFIRPMCRGNFKFRLYTSHSYWDPGAKYKWSTGDTSKNLIVNKAGEYSVTVTPSSGSTLNFKIVLDECPAEIWIPEAFTPNGDGLNEYFLVKSWKVIQYQMWIYNQSGKLLFSTGKTKDPESTIGWNGKDKKGNICPRGYYLYVIKCIFGDKTEKKYSGSVQILDTR